VELGMTARKNMLPMQPGDVMDTHADTARLAALSGYEPGVPVREGVRRFVAWYREYYAAREAGEAADMLARAG
jgi:UDP-glucuronate 4-epimerase